MDSRWTEGKVLIDRYDFALFWNADVLECWEREASFVASGSTEHIWNSKDGESGGGKAVGYCAVSSDRF